MNNLTKFDIYGEIVLTCDFRIIYYIVGI